MRSYIILPLLIPNSKYPSIISFDARNIYFSPNEDKNCVTFWHTLFRHHSNLPLDLDPQSMFTHTTSLQDVPKQPLSWSPSPQSSCHMFWDSDIQHVIWDMNTSRSTDEEGFQAKFLKHGIRPLAQYITNIFKNVVCSRFLPKWSNHPIHPIHKSRSNIDPNNYWTIMVGHTFSKLYAMTLHWRLSENLMRDIFKARFR